MLRHVRTARYAINSIPCSASALVCGLYHHEYLRYHGEYIHRVIVYHITHTSHIMRWGHVSRYMDLWYKVPDPCKYVVTLPIHSVEVVYHNGLLYRYWHMRLGPTRGTAQYRNTCIWSVYPTPLQ